MYNNNNYSNNSNNNSNHNNDVNNSKLDSKPNVPQPRDSSGSQISCEKDDLTTLGVSECGFVVKKIATEVKIDNLEGNFRLHKIVKCLSDDSTIVTKVHKSPKPTLNTCSTISYC